MADGADAVPVDNPPKERARIMSGEHAALGRQTKLVSRWLIVFRLLICREATVQREEQAIAWGA